MMDAIKLFTIGGLIQQMKSI